MTRSRWILLAVIGGGLVAYLLATAGEQTLDGTGDTVARSLYLGVWAIVLAAGILGSGRRLGYVARSLALWLLIVLLLVPGTSTATSFRTSRAGSRPGSCPAARSRSPTAKASLRSCSRSCPTAISSGRIVVNGVPVDGHRRHRRDEHGAHRGRRPPRRLRRRWAALHNSRVDRQRHSRAAAA